MIAAKPITSVDITAAEITQKAVFASDTVDLTHGWSLLAGLRLTDYSQKGLGADGARTSEYDKNGVLTPTLALMHNLTPRTMAYASYIESLEAGSVVSNTYTNAGALLDPLKNKQYEFGLKTEQDDWATTAALFRIEKKAENPVVDPDSGRARLEQNGLSRYQGLELAASARLAKNWNFGGSLMFLNSEYRQGTRYNDNRIAGYETTFRAGINNLANKRYWLYQTPEYIKPGDPRSYRLSASVKF